MLPRRIFRREIAPLVALVLGLCAFNAHAQSRKPSTEATIVGMLSVRAQGKKEFRQSVTLLAGQEASIEAQMEKLGPAPGQARENPKDGLKYVWIPPGTFMMGCSPGDSKCHDGEKPAHHVTITRGF
jgi:formylglycine-generating enzyme required for sulfatase activity